MASGDDFKQFGCLLFIVTAAISVIYGAVRLAKLYASSDTSAVDILSSNFLNNDTNTTTAPFTNQPTPFTRLTGSITYFIFGCGVLMGLAALGAGLYHNNQRFRSLIRNYLGQPNPEGEELRELNSGNLNNAV